MRDKVQEDWDKQLNLENKRCLRALVKKGIKLGDTVVNKFGKRGIIKL